MVEATQAPDRLHNQPPDPIDQALAPYGDAISEAENWLDGEAVQSEGQMQAVDQIKAEVHAALKAVKAGEESEAKPVYDEWKRIKARWKPTIDDLERIKKGLTALVDGFKRKLAAERAEAERKAREEAERKRREAEAKAAAVQTANIDADREAAQAQHEATEAQKSARDAQKASKEVKGLRTVTKYEITDHRALLHWIAQNDREAITAFIEEYARRHHRETQQADGLRVWTEKAAF